MEIRIDEPWITDKVRVQNGYVYIDHSLKNTKQYEKQFTFSPLGRDNMIDVRSDL